MKSETKRVLWAVDLFPVEVSLEKTALSLLVSWQKILNFEIHPVYVATDLGTKQLPYLESEFNQRLQSYKMGELKPGKIIGGQGLYPPSVYKQVDQLLTYGDQIDTDLICVQTTNRKGISRLFLGSFAETTLLNSGRPVLVLNPTTQLRETPKKIMVPMNLAVDPSFAFVDRVCEVAKRFDAKIYIYHKLETGTYASLRRRQQLDDDNEKELARRQSVAEKHLQEIENHAKGLQVQVQSILDADLKPMKETLEEYMENLSIDLLMMPATSGQTPLTSVGSTTRQIVREVTCPVWVIPTI